MNREDGRKQMQALVEDFEKNYQHYIDNCNEAQLRKSHIDKFYSALGWNVNGEIGIAPENQEVVVEESVENEDDNIKFVDYAFRLYGVEQMLSKAKKALENINNKKHIFQVKSYGFSKRIPFVILTNFKEMKIFDISTKPLINQPDTDLVEEFHLKYTDYVEKFDLLWDTIGKEAVEGGSLKRLYAKRRKISLDEIEGVNSHEHIIIKGSSLLDEAFLNDMQKWRKELAKDIVDNNSAIEEGYVEELVQLILDTTIFIRILEDRGIEEEQILKEIIQAYDKKNNQGLKSKLDEIYVKMGKKYGGSLFEKEELFKNYNISNNTLEKFIDEFYYPQSPYRFNDIKVEILGSMFEQFLGSKIKIADNNQVEIELKPQYRRKGGVYYTPEYIVDSIVKNTLEPLLDKKSISEILELKVIDIASGSGGFLIKAYKYIMQYCLKMILADKVLLKEYKEKGDLIKQKERYILGFNLKKQILSNCIYGVDVDTNAVEISKMSLYITLLEDADYIKGNRSIKHILPELDNNIKCGDSIVGTEYSGIVSNNNNITVFNWKKEFIDIFAKNGFDCVLGNPPYIRYQLIEEIYSEDVKGYWKKQFKEVAIGNYDLCVLFIKKALDILNEKGKLGYIVSNKFFDCSYGTGLREVIKANNYLREVVDFGDIQIFKDSTTYTALLFLDKDTEQKTFKYTDASKLERWIEGNYEAEIIDKKVLDEDRWVFCNKNEKKLYDKIVEGGYDLKSIADRIFVGIQTNGDKIYMVEEVRSDENYLYCKSAYTNKEHKFEKQHLKKVVKGLKDLGENIIKDNRKMRLIFPYNVMDGKAYLINRDEYKEKYPCTWAYLNECKDMLIGRSKSSNGKKIYMNEENWYGYVYQKNLIRYESNKILLPSMYLDSTFAYDEDAEYYFIGSGTGGGGGYAITLKEGVNSIYNYYSLLGVLNCNVVRFQMKLIGSTFDNGYYGIKKEMLEKIALPKPESKKEYEILNKLTDSSKKAIRLRKQIYGMIACNEQKKLNKQYENLIYINNQCCYKLYKLTEDEIKLIEAYIEEN